jgi:hypothetical protein
MNSQKIIMGLALLIATSSSMHAGPKSVTSTNVFLNNKTGAAPGGENTGVTPAIQPVSNISSAAVQPVTKPTKEELILKNIEKIKKNIREQKWNKIPATLRHSLRIIYKDIINAQKKSTEQNQSSLDIILLQRMQKIMQPIVPEVKKMLEIILQSQEDEKAAFDWLNRMGISTPSTKSFNEDKEKSYYIGSYLLQLNTDIENTIKKYHDEEKLDAHKAAPAPKSRVKQEESN